MPVTAELVLELRYIQLLPVTGGKKTNEMAPAVLPCFHTPPSLLAGATSTYGANDEEKVIITGTSRVPLNP